MSATEEWRAIREAPDYAISSLGRVKRLVPDQLNRRDGLILKPLIHKGYHRYCLAVDGAKIYRSAHALVCEAFHGPRPPGRQCAHKDGSRTNNAPDNLYWATPKENCEDRKKHGRQADGDKHWTRLYPEKVVRGVRSPGDWARGERAAAAKLTEGQVLEILATPRYHGSGKMLAERFGVSMGLIGHIRNGRAWTYLRPHAGKSPSPRGGGLPIP